MKNKIVKQTGNWVGGDQIAGDKKVYIVKEIAKAKNALRDELGFDPDTDKENTTLTKKLKDGKINADARRSAIRSKLKSLKLLLKMCKSDHGKKVVADLYDNLITVIETRYLFNMNEGEHLKANMDQIYGEFTFLVKKYEDMIDLDEAFISGLLYIATSNCAIKWTIGDAS
ncbi:hypothetical protein [Lentibacillus saliphilus]|uniref:hypothetical protein n=1 Tax=Lentibacillus saliphilus TaxID=2737028 RepID=UPI001C303014|nr:hypothetical protein [Lentibacillus saliphilus]